MFTSSNTTPDDGSTVHYIQLHLPVLGTELIRGSMVEQQGVDMVIQDPDCLLSPQTEAGCHRYNGRWWAVGL